MNIIINSNDKSSEACKCPRLMTSFTSSITASAGDYKIFMDEITLRKRRLFLLTCMFNANVILSFDVAQRADASQAA